MDKIAFFVLYISFFLGIFGSVILNRIKKYRNNNINGKHVNEESYQNYAKFYGNIVPSDNDFNNKFMN